MCIDRAVELPRLSFRLSLILYADCRYLSENIERARDSEAAGPIDGVSGRAASIVFICKDTV